MEFMIISLVVLLIALVLLRLLSRKPAAKTQRTQWQINRQLLPPAVRKFKAVLTPAIAEHYELLTRVAVADLIHTNDDNAEVVEGHLDFVLLAKEAGGALAVVQLESHHLDEEIQTMLKQVRLPLVIIDDAVEWAEDEILQFIQTKLEPIIVVSDPSSPEVKVYLDPEKNVAESDIRLSLD